MKKTTFSALWPLIALGVFALCILLTIMSGADSYKNLNAVNEESYTQRTAVRYLSTKIHQNDMEDTLSVLTPESGSGVSGDAVKISEFWDGEEYATYIYCYDGYLTENYMYVEEGQDIYWDCGSRVVEAESLKIDRERFYEEGMFCVTVAYADGSEQELKVKLRTEVRNEI